MLNHIETGNLRLFEAELRWHQTTRESHRSKRNRLRQQGSQTSLLLVCFDRFHWRKAQQQHRAVSEPRFGRVGHWWFGIGLHQQVRQGLLVKQHLWFRNGDICGNWGRPTSVKKEWTSMVNWKEEEKNITYDCTNERISRDESLRTSACGCCCWSEDKVMRQRKVCPAELT